MVAKRDEQRGMFDVELEDEDFEAAIKEWIDLKSTRQTLAAVKRRIDEGKERHNIKSMDDGQRVRVGEYTFETKARSGGDFHMPPWETVGMAGLRSIGGPDLKVVD